MILRKPYAFLIKHFKLIHLIITFFLGLTAYKSKKIYDFINTCIVSPGNKYNASSYVSFEMFIYILVAILLMFIIRWLLKYKDKPRSIYLYSMLYYAVICVVLSLVFVYLEKIPTEEIVQKTIRLYRDIMLIALILQYIITTIMLVRGLGFDIKKFNFRKDFEEMNISEEDAEEIEVNIFSKAPKIMNKVRSQKRELGYYYKENKIIIITILVVIALVIVYSGYKFFDKKLKTYSEGDTVGLINYFEVLNSYYYELSGKKYVIVKFNINTLKSNSILNTGIVNLTIDKKSYIPNKNICFQFKTKGVCYKKQLVTKEKNPYILVYEVDSFDNNKTYINYNESNELKYKIKLNLQKY